MRHFRLKRLIIAIVAWSLTSVSLLFMFGTAPASADDSCDAIIADQTSTRVLGDQSRVIAAASQLPGYTIRVRAFDTAPQGSLDAYLARMLSSCASWQNAEQSGTIVVLAFTMDRKTLAHLSNVSQSRADDVRTAMSPYFKSGDFQGGVSAALAKATTYMNGAGSGTGSGSAPAPSAPTNWAAIGAFFMWTCIILGGATVFVTLFLVVRWGRRRQRALAAAKRKLNSARTSAADSRNSLDLFIDVDQELKYLRESITEGVFARLDNTLNAFVAQRDEITETFDELERQYGEVGNDPDAINSLTSEYEALKNDADNASQTLGTLKSDVSAIQSAIENAPVQLATLKSQLAAFRSQCENLQTQGFVTGDATNAANQADNLLTEVEKLISEDRSGYAIEQLERAETILTESTDQINDAPRKLQALKARYQQLSDQSITGHSDIDAASKLLDNLVREHGRANMGKLTTASKLRDSLASAIASINSASATLEPKDMPWSKATSVLDSAEKTLQGLREDIARIREHTDALDELALTLPTQINQLVEDAAACKANIEDRDGDQDEHLRDIKTLIKKVGKLDYRRGLIAAGQEYAKLSANLDEIDAASKQTDREAHQRTSSSHSYGGRYGSNDDGFVTGFAVGSTLGSGHHHDPTPRWPSSSGSSSGGWDFGNSSSSTSSGGWDSGGGSSSSTSSGDW